MTGPGSITERNQRRILVIVTLAEGVSLTDILINMRTEVLVTTSTVMMGDTKGLLLMKTKILPGILSMAGNLEVVILIVQSTMTVLGGLTKTFEMLIEMQKDTTLEINMRILDTEVETRTEK